MYLNALIDIPFDRKNLAAYKIFCDYLCAARKYIYFIHVAIILFIKVFNTWLNKK